MKAMTFMKFMKAIKAMGFINVMKVMKIIGMPAEDLGIQNGRFLSKIALAGGRRRRSFFPETRTLGFWNPGEQFVVIRDSDLRWLRT